MPQHPIPSAPDDDLFAPPTASEWAQALGLAVVLGGAVFAVITLALR